MASRELNCLPGVRPAAVSDGYAALGDRCEGDTEVPTAGEPRLVSLTEGEPHIDDKANEVSLSWNPIAGEVCLSAQPDSIDTQLPRWRMTRRALPNERAFTWSSARAREMGVVLSKLGFAARPCQQSPADLIMIPVRVGAPRSATPPVVALIQTTSEVRTADITSSDTRDDGSREMSRPKPVAFSPHDPHPSIWFALPNLGKGPGTTKVTVSLRGSSAFGDPAPVVFSFRHQ